MNITILHVNGQSILKKDKPCTFPKAALIPPIALNNRNMLHLRLRAIFFMFFIVILGGCSDGPTASDIREAFILGRRTGQFVSVVDLDPHSVVVKKSSAKDVWDITYSEMRSKTKTHIQVVPKKRKHKGYLLHVINSEWLFPSRPEAKTQQKASTHMMTQPKHEEPKVDMVALTDKLKSFAGFTFGKDYWNNPPKNKSYHEPGHLRTYYLSTPFRYLDRANIHDRQDRNTAKKRVTVQVTIFGVLPQEYTEEEIYKEYATVAKIVEDKYSIKMKKESNIHYVFECGSIEIELWCWGDSHNMFLKVWNAYPFQGVEFKRPEYSAPKKLSPNEGSNVL